jgi:phospholipase/carboxylesterase
MTDLLDFEIHRPEEPRAGAPVAVLLHGRGSHMGDLLGLADMLPSDWFLVTPQAPFPASDWGYGEGWAWYGYLGEDRVVEEALTHSLDRVDRFLAALPEVIGVEPGPVTLGGFSQGGTMSTAHALTRPGAVRAVLNFSGFLAASVPVPSGEAALAATPIFWGHGLRDPAIPFDIARRGRATISEAGVPLVTRDYDIGHWIVPDEMRDAVAMVESL